MRLFSNPVQHISRIALGAVFSLGVFGIASAAQTPAGTNITNTATATYTDNNNNSLNAVSNTVTTVVQNAPSLTNVASSSQTVSPNSNVTQSYTLTNTGNSAGAFNLSAASISGGAASVTSYTVTVQGLTAQTFTTFAALQTYLQGQQIPAGNTASLQINYNSGATSAGTVVTGTVTSTIVNPAVGAAVAQTSSAVTATEADTVQNDGRLDVQKTSTQNSTTGVITYTIAANNGGSFTAHYVQALSNASFGFGALTTTGTIGGILVADKIPTFAGGNPALTGIPTVSFARGTNGFPTDASETADYVCSTSTDGSTGWSTTCNAVSKWIGVLVHGGSLANSSTGGDGLLANSSGSTSTGGSSNGPKVTAAAFTLTFSITPPSGTGSANTNSITNIANGIFTNNNSTPQIVGPAGPSTDSSTNTAAVIADIANASPNTGNGLAGSSQSASNSALANFVVFTGPLSAATALGDYSNTGTATVNNDFTAYAFQDSTSLPTTTSTDPNVVTGNSTSAVQTFWVSSDVKNTGNKDDSITLSATPPNFPGWTAQLVTANGGSTALGGAAPAGPGAFSTTATPISLVSGSPAFTYYVKYTAPAGTLAYKAFDAKITATGSSNGATTNVNDTHHEIYNGFLPLTKEATVVSDGCPAGVTGTFGTNGGNVGAGTTKACPGGVVRYDIFYKNLSMGNSGTGATEPASALLSAKPGTFAIADDGTSSGSWYAPFGTPVTYVTSGVNAVPSLVVTPFGGTATANAASTCTYSYGNPAAGPTATFTAPTFGASPTNGPSKSSCVIGGAAFSVSPGDQGTLSFSVTIRAN